MDIKLKTNSEEQLEFREIERFSDGSGYAARFIIHSRGFSVETLFDFETQPFDTFISDLEKMNHTLKGKAQLKPLYDEHFIEFKIDDQGHIRVRGEMIEYSHMPQKLSFEFETDQTCLEPLIYNLKQWQKM